MTEHLRTVALVAIGVGLIYSAYVASEQRRWDRHSCEAQNEVRTEINKRGRILRDFLDSAALVRHDTALVQLERGDREEARLNLEVAREWEHWADLIEVLEIAECEELVAEAQT